MTIYEKELKKVQEKKDRITYILNNSDIYTKEELEEKDEIFVRQVWAALWWKNNIMHC